MRSKRTIINLLNHTQLRLLVAESGGIPPPTTSHTELVDRAVLSDADTLEQFLGRMYLHQLRRISYELGIRVSTRSRRLLIALILRRNQHGLAALPSAPVLADNHNALSPQGADLALVLAFGVPSADMEPRSLVAEAIGFALAAWPTRPRGARRWLFLLSVDDDKNAKPWIRLALSSSVPWGLITRINVFIEAQFGPVTYECGLVPDRRVEPLLAVNATGTEFPPSGVQAPSDLDLKSFTLRRVSKRRRHIIANGGIVARTLH